MTRESIDYVHRDCIIVTCAFLFIVAVSLINLGALAGPQIVSLATKSEKVLAYSACAGLQVSALLFCIRAAFRLKQPGSRRSRPLYKVIVAMIIAGLLSGNAAGVFMMKKVITIFTVSGGNRNVFEAALEANKAGSGYRVLVYPGEDTVVIARKNKLHQVISALEKRGLSKLP